MLLRTNDGTTEEAVRNGILTIRRLYRARCCQLECLEILYPELGAFNTNCIIMIITIMDLDASEQEPREIKPREKKNLVRYSYIKAAINAGKIQKKRKCQHSPLKKQRGMVDTPGASSSEDFKTPTKRWSPRKNLNTLNRMETHQKSNNLRNAR